MELPLAKTGEAIDPLWAAEFCGMFMGEGMLSFCSVARVRMGRKDNSRVVTGPFFRNEAIMVLRADDEAVLLEFCRILGGHVNDRPGNLKKNQAPAKRWVCTSIEDNLRVGKILSTCRLPAKKMLELPIWMEALELRSAGRGHHHTQETRDRLEELRQEIYRVRAYSVDKVQDLQSGRSFLSPSLT